MGRAALLQLGSSILGVTKAPFRIRQPKISSFSTTTPTTTNYVWLSNEQQLSLLLESVKPTFVAATSRRQMSSNNKQNNDNDNDWINNATKFKTILLSKPDKHIAHIELNQPRTKNAFSVETAKEFIGALECVECSPGVRCVILSGNGPDLTSGVDLKSFMTVYGQLQETEDVAHRAKLLYGVVKTFQSPFKKMQSLSKPIICVQHGLCYGLGMELAACSDIRYCSNDTKFAIREVLIGIAADVGSLQAMPKLVSNQSLLNELIFTGRNLKVEEALSLGFVSRVLNSKAEAMDEAFATARLIAKRSPVAVQGSKHNLRFSRDKSFIDGLDYNAVWNMSMMQGADVTRAITAILSKAVDEVEYDDF